MTEDKDKPAEPFSHGSLRPGYQDPYRENSDDADKDWKSGNQKENEKDE